MAIANIKTSVDIFITVIFVKSMRKRKIAKIKIAKEDIQKDANGGEPVKVAEDLIVIIFMLPLPVMMIQGFSVMIVLVVQIPGKMKPVWLNTQ